jgi:amino-acid N-acetyltransferase
MTCGSVWSPCSGARDGRENDSTSEPVAPDLRGTGLGAAVLRRALLEAQGRPGGVYALTTTAERYLSRFGFERIDRSSVPESLMASRELQDACPSSATVMKRAR